MSGGANGLPRQPAGACRFQTAEPPSAGDALINPVREAGEEPVTPTVVMTFTQPDYRDLCRLAGTPEQPRQVWSCACRRAAWEGASLTVVAPALGAPYAAMVLEKLIVLGARRVLVLGWCGSLSPRVHIGDLILPDRAIPGDGTSPHYSREPDGIPPHPALFNLLAAGLGTARSHLARGPGVVHRRLLPGDGGPGATLPGPGGYRHRPGTGGPLRREPLPGHCRGGTSGGF